MELGTLLIKKLPQSFENVDLVTATSDLKLLSIHDVYHNLEISLIRNNCSHLTLTDVKSFAWQEDNYSQDNYKLLVVDIYNEIWYYNIGIEWINSHTPSLGNKNLAKWILKDILQYFQELAKNLADVSSIEILKFEAKEAVFLFDGKIIVSLFPSECDPQVIAISDLTDDCSSHRKIRLSKEMLFALNDTGTKISVYSFSNNSKLFEFECFDSNSKLKECGAVKYFTVHSKLEFLIYVTEKDQIYFMPLNITSQVSQHSSPQVISTVTAFTKQFPSVKRLNDSLRRYCTSSGSVKPVCFSTESSDMNLKDLIIVGNKLFFAYHGDSQSLVGIHILDADEPTVCQRYPCSAFLIKSGSEEVPFPPMLFCENKIFLLSYDIEQDRLVNELMIYPSSGTVEALASLNNWDSIHMDIEVLRLGLSNRQLYTAEFFLKTLFEGFCQQWNLPLSLQWLEKIKEECSLWERILDLVFDSVCKNLDESFSCQYAEQLLQVIIRMMTQILAVVESKQADESYFSQKEKDETLTKFSNFLLKMRKLLREKERSVGKVPRNEEDITLYNDDILQQWKKWKKLSKEEVILDSVLHGIIPMAQSFFSCYSKDNLKTSYKEFEAVCEKFFIDYLRQGQMTETLILLSNMGIDENSKLLEIFSSTSERDIRSLILPELRVREIFTNSDKKSLQFVSLLEKLYPCTLFEHARVLLDEKSALSESDVNCAIPESHDTLPVGDFMDFNQDNSESGAYCRIVMNWLSTWDDDVKSRILASHYLKNSPVLDFFIREEGASIEISPLSVWFYLLENGNLPYLMNWIDIWLGSFPQNSDNFSILDKWPLNEVMINAIPEKATFYVSETVLNALARHGIFCEEELEDISLFLNRIGQSQCDINDKAVFSSEKASLSFTDLCHRLVHYSLKHHLVHFLYSFISNNYYKFSIWPSCHLCDVPLLKLVKAFYLWSTNHNDTHLAYDAAAVMAQYIFNLQSTSTTDLLTNLPLPLSLAILLFKSVPLSQSIEELRKSSETAVECVKEKFQACPLLYNYLFKSSEERSQPDITVYELLKGSSVFDTSQLFGWQSANSLKSEDSQNELPHFSLKSLSEQYGLKKELTYLYYLMEGRPNYSYLKFIAQEVVLETGLSISRVRSTCRDVTDYALSNYRCSVICAACISFIELLGQDSLSLRTCLIAANMLHENQLVELDPECDKSYPEIGAKFKQANVHKEAAASLISELENIILRSWNSYNTESNALFEDIVLWMPVMMLSHLYAVEAGNIYMNECAKQNSWLKFLVFAQIFQIPKEQVLKAASRFSNSCISYHIFQALSRKSPMLYEAVFQTKTAPTLKPTKRDMRKSLYSRIGVIKGTPKVDVKKSQDQEDDKISVTSEETASTTSSDVDIRSFVLKDLFSQLLLAHSSDTPWECLLHTSYEIKNPVLAVFAATYNNSPYDCCFFMWLYTSLYRNDVVQKQLDSCFPQVLVTSCNINELEKLILLAVSNNKILTLWQGIHFFLPTTPLLPLMEFLRSFIINKKFDASIELFQNQIWDYPKNSKTESVLHSLLWIENISVSILKEAVIGCSTNYERLKLLRHFSHTRLEKSFSKEVVVPPFMKVYQMLQHLGDVGKVINVNSLFLPESDTSYRNVCWEAVKSLIECHLHEDARKFAIAAKLPLDEMFLLQINQECDEAQKCSSWTNLSYRVDFWRNILVKLNDSIIPVEATVDFIEVRCEISDSYAEKYFLMRFIIDILNRENERLNSTNFSTYNMEALKKKMWWWCIKAEINKELVSEILDIKPVHEFGLQDVSLNIGSASHSHCIEDEKEKEALGSIIGHFLCKRDVHEAFQLADTFGYESHDLKIIKICLQLAREEIDFTTIEAPFPDCAPELTASRVIRSLMLWLATVDTGITESQRSTIECLEKLSRKSKVAVTVCHQILVHYTVASVLKNSYISIVKEKDAFFTLKQILIRKLNDEHILAKSFIVVEELSDKDVAKFLSEEIWGSLQTLCLSDTVMLPERKSAFSEDLIYDPLQRNQGFQLIVKLCQDPSILGNLLMTIFSTEADEFSATASDQSFLSLVELCICAHECFTAACNMDGISLILHNSQQLVSILEEAEKFTIMVRLLTGLERYSEMMYVFDVLKSHDKFNLLLDKENENVPNLRLALLDYRKNCPASENDNYIYTLAKRFGMYREKAEILEMSVQKQLSQLCKKNTGNDLQEELESAVQLLAEAARSYCKADCLHQAQNCTRLAQLVALQIYFLPSGVWIIGLNESSVARFITDHDKFPQAYIVAEEYRNHQLWSQAVLNNVVIRGNREYLREFQANMGVSSSLVNDVAKRFQKVVNKTESMAKNMKLLLSSCSNVKVKYTLSQDLGFSDITSELLMGEGSSYIQDLIANNVVK